MRARFPFVWLSIALLVASCASPPAKEIGQAQGAVDAARAVGADRYAPDELAAATKALAAANQAVAQRDFRLALNHALDSREHAQTAAREAADTRARLRGDAERSMAQVAALLVQAHTRLTAAERDRVPTRTVRSARRALTRVEDDVQKASAAMKADDYGKVQPALNGVPARIEEVIASLDAAMASQLSRRRR